MRRANTNEAITRLPILLAARSEAEGEGWVSGPELAQVLSGAGMVTKRYPVRVVPKDALGQFADRRTRPGFESVFGRVPQDLAAKLLALLAIANAAKEGNATEVARLAWRSEISKGISTPYAATASAVREPWDRVGATLNEGLIDKGTTPVLWQKESYKQRQYMPALLCVDAAHALFAHALFLIAGKRGVGICSRCGSVFFVSRKQQAFCSYRCRTAEAMKRYRANLKQKGSERRKRARQSRSSKGTSR